MIDLASPSTYAAGIPHEEFHQLRMNDPVSWRTESNGPGYWAVTRHADVVTVLRNPAIFSSHRGGVRIEDLPPEFLSKVRENLMNSDPPDHTKLRRLTNHVFRPGRVAVLRKRVEALAELLIEQVIERGECDFAQEVAGALPLFLICEILGVPEEDRLHLNALTHRMFGSSSEDRVLAMKDSMAAALEMREYAATVASRRGALRGEDLISDLLECQLDGRKLTLSEFQAFFMLLFNAGADTTRSLLCFAMDLLMRHPQAVDSLRSDPSQLPGAIEEVLRFETIVILVRRTATVATQLQGVDIREGDKVVVFFPSANRDEAVFANADAFDISRITNPHLSFGQGPHLCLGAPLARMQAEILLREVLRRMSAFSATGPLRTPPSNFVRSVSSLPIRFSAR